MPESNDPDDLSFNGIRFREFCDPCRVTLMAMRIAKLPRGEICQPCALRLIAAASATVPSDPGPPEARVQPVIDARLARLMGRRIAAPAPGIAGFIRPDVDPTDLFPGAEIIEFDLRDPYCLELMRQARKMETALRELQSCGPDGECPDCGWEPDTKAKHDHADTCRIGNILKALDASRVLHGN